MLVEPAADFTNMRALSDAKNSCSGTAEAENKLCFFFFFGKVLVLQSNCFTPIKLNSKGCDGLHAEEKQQ